MLSSVNFPWTWIHWPISSLITKKDRQQIDCTLELQNTTLESSDTVHYISNTFFVRIPPLLHLYLIMKHHFISPWREKKYVLMQNHIWAKFLESISVVIESLSVKLLGAKKIRRISIWWNFDHEKWLWCYMTKLWLLGKLEIR